MTAPATANMFADLDGPTLHNATSTQATTSACSDRRDTSSTTALGVKPGSIDAWRVEQGYEPVVRREGVPNSAHDAELFDTDLMLPAEHEETPPPERWVTQGEGMYSSVVTVSYRRHICQGAAVLRWHYGTTNRVIVSAPDN